MPNQPIIDFSHLTTAERIELAMQLWDSLPETEIVTSDAELEIIKRRRAELDADGDPGEDWEKVLDDIEKAKG